MGKIRILHLLQSDRYSGAENVVCQIIKAFEEDSTFEMVYCSQEGPIRDVLAKNEIKFYPVEVLNYKNAKRVIQEYKPHIIHSHDAKASLISALLSSNYSVISHMHNNAPWIKSFGIKSILYYLSSLKFKKILTVSDVIMQEYVYGKKLNDKTLVIGNPIDSDSIRKKAKINGTQNKIYDIAFVGRLTSEKDPLRFLYIIKELKKILPNVSVVMIGDGDLKLACLDYIDEHSLHENITLTGFLENPFEILLKSRVLVMTSKWEGFGLVAIEALSLGVPVICPPVGGLLNIIGDENGKICNSNEEFLIELYNILTNLDYQKEKSHKAIDSSSKMNNLLDYKEKILDVYKEVR
ncbi:glycosyltransferase [Planococcus sp. N064]|uniref:Glycosyltransferase n=1 Tax=Planococcus liqunii TaxID=3058394 RepID=A0ABT8MNI6_9BACL|nr:glycosyltransferase [Planococcus sp. N064]MDN7226433.1 glycosyltransferase [Planococcus sp. N064]